MLKHLHLPITPVGVGVVGGDAAGAHHALDAESTHQRPVELPAVADGALVPSRTQARRPQALTSSVSRSRYGRFSASSAPSLRNAVSTASSLTSSTDTESRVCSNHHLLFAVAVHDERITTQDAVYRLTGAARQISATNSCHSLHQFLLSAQLHMFHTWCILLHIMPRVELFALLNSPHNVPINASVATTLMLPLTSGGSRGRQWFVAHDGHARIQRQKAVHPVAAPGTIHVGVLPGQCCLPKFFILRYNANQTIIFCFAFKRRPCPTLSIGNKSWPS